jgi:hypothetical protein
MDMLYLALFPDRESEYVHWDLLKAAPNRFAELLPRDASWATVIQAVRREDLAGAERRLLLAADAIEQRAVCCVREREAGPPVQPADRNKAGAPCSEHIRD